MIDDIDVLKAAEVAGLDGPLLESTQNIMRSLGAAEADVNRWWLLTPALWWCPSCNRRKEEIARLNSAGKMMGHIVRHHDHMADVVLAEFHRASGAHSHVVATELSEAFVARAAGAVSAYDPVLICQDCNNADTRAKREIPTDRRFSFSAQDISNFILPRPNSDHAINVDIARQLWERYRSTFESRISLIEQIAGIAAAAEDWFQGHTPRLADPSAMELGVANALAHAMGLPSGVELRQHFMRLQVPRRRNNVVPGRWRTIIPAPSKAPSAGEIEHAAKVTHRGHWQSVPDLWRCPACKRIKAQTVRPSGKFAWAFEVKAARLFDPIKVEPARIHICGDCSNVRRDLAKEANVPPEVISIDDLADIICAEPHRRHRIESDGVERVIAVLAARAERGGGRWD